VDFKKAGKEYVQIGVKLLKAMGESSRLMKNANLLR